ncbi:hypothetical protein SAMN05216387_102159 [Nitrosovibrio tenuis]|uniref:Uncharacterized protein n=1 Tax=Nitrosovibrio tenuis TaxID=1233 RepID=A0A1H7IG96_9PROT|nr:hypothetical protein SAMN05216387_102159 [Nitrosovibrio tenuis]
MKFNNDYGKGKRSLQEEGSGGSGAVSAHASQEEMS